MPTNKRGFVQGTAHVTYLHADDERRQKNHCLFFKEARCTFKHSICDGSAHCLYYKTEYMSPDQPTIANNKSTSLERYLPNVSKTITVTILERDYLRNNTSCITCGDELKKCWVPIILLGEKDPTQYCGLIDNVKGFRCDNCGRYFITTQTVEFIRRRFELSRTNVRIMSPG